MNRQNEVADEEYDGDAHAGGAMPGVGGQDFANMGISPEV